MLVKNSVSTQNRKSVESHRAGIGDTTRIKQAIVRIYLKYNMETCYNDIVLVRNEESWAIQQAKMKLLVCYCFLCHFPRFILNNPSP